MDWSSDSIAVVMLLLGVLGFLWRLQTDVRGLDRDMRSLSDRVARVEGLLQDFRGLSDRVGRVEGLLEGLRDTIAGRSERT